MARPSLYPIELAEDEERELRHRAARYTLPYRDVQRAKTILMAAQGLENGEIARRLRSGSHSGASGSSASRTCRWRR